MISIDNLSLYFGAQNVFEDISFMINSGDKIGLVGKNGSGKSTLLRLLTNQITPNSGKVTHLKNTVIGYLQQDIDFQDKYTLKDEMSRVFSNIETYKKDIEKLNKDIANRSDYNSKSYLDLLNKLSKTEELLRLEGGHDISLQINKILKGLGFQPEDLDKHTSDFSGGWRMRIELAKILLKNPDIILLDEPTNHLDIISIIWLEKWLQNYNGAIILVSHDRNFLDAIINRTIEISFSKINNYKANYSRYLDLRKDRQEKQVQAKKNQDKYIEQTKMLINKFRAKKNKAAFAQTLVKKLSKLDIIEVEQDDVSKMNFRFPPAPHSGKVTFKMKNIYKSYGKKEILKNINLEINKGEKIAFVGKNGEGKTTLAKIIVSDIEFEGKTHFGYNVQYGYYAQNQSDFLDEDKTILQTIEDAMTAETNLKVRDVLGSFLLMWIKKLVFCLVERGHEFHFANFSYLRSIFLIMDEPNLDIISKDILKKALINFDGTLIIISHDRSFLQGLSNKIFEFKNHVIKEYLGDINSFLQNQLGSLGDLNKGFKSTKKSILKKDSAQKISYQKEKSMTKKFVKLKNRFLILKTKFLL